MEVFKNLFVSEPENQTLPTFGVDELLYSAEQRLEGRLEKRRGQWRKSGHCHEEKEEEEQERKYFKK